MQISHFGIIAMIKYANTTDNQGITTSYIIFGTEMLPYSKHFITFATAIGKQGTLTEWLGSGLQNRARQFDSARYLK